MSTGINSTQTNKASYSDIKKSLDILYKERDMETGSLWEYMTNPFQLIFAGFGGWNALKNKKNINVFSQCNTAAERYGAGKLMEIDNAFLSKMCNHKDASISEQAKVLKQRVDILKLNGGNSSQITSLLNDFEQLSKQAHNARSGIGKAWGALGQKLPGVKRAWGAHGGTGMIVMGLVMEAFMTIPKAFKAKVDSDGNKVDGVNWKAGFKQTGKSLIRQVINAGGWVGGAAAGAAIGSIIPGAGTAIGGIIGFLAGFIGGNLGMFSAEKLAEVTKLSETEGVKLNNIAQEKENKKDAKAIQKGNTKQLEEFKTKVDEWLAANIVDKNGQIRTDLSEETEKQYKQIERTCKQLKLTA